MVARGFADNETRAQALIIAGKVYTGERRLEKPGQKISDDAPLEVRKPDYPWVSRGGVKLAHALERFDIDPSGQAALDIGAATGGFWTCFYLRAQHAFMPLMSGMGSSIGAYATTLASWFLSEPMHAT